MTGFITLQSDHGPIYFEVDDHTADTYRDASGGLTPKGAIPRSDDNDVPIGRFDRAMSTLKAYAGSIQDIVNDLDVRPKEVTVEVGLTFKGEAGVFAIAKAGTEAEMKIALKWAPEAQE